jgi:NAD(P)-dependent dehydrogenase (short-subunit alcohol dehydrogenase family)
MSTFYHNLVIIGASGLVGTSLFRELIKSNDYNTLKSIHLVDICCPDYLSLLPSHFSFQKLNVLIQDDLARLVTLICELESPVVINLAAKDYTSSVTIEKSPRSFSPDDRAFIDIMEINLVFPYRLVRALTLTGKQGLRLVHIGSIYGLRMPHPSLYGLDRQSVKPAPYAISKAALISLVKHAAFELSCNNSESFMVSLGGIESSSHPAEFVSNYNRISEGFGLVDECMLACALLNAVIHLPPRVANGTNIILDNGYTIF